MPDQPERPLPVFYRRRLPHWQPDGAVIFVTWRIDGALPRRLLQAISDVEGRLESSRKQPKETEEDKSLRVAKIAFGLLDKALDEVLTSATSCSRWLEDPRVASLVRDSFHFWGGERYVLHRYVVMPNHVHILLEPLLVGVESEEDHAEGARVALRDIAKGLKGYTAREANRILGRTGRFWRREYFDHWVRNPAEYARIVDYIDQNPVRAGLCSGPADWPWSSSGEGKQKDSGA